MSEELIGAWSGKPLTISNCNLCGQRGKGNTGLWLCDMHISIIVREHAPHFLSELQAKILAAVEAIPVRSMSEWGEHGDYSMKQSVLAAIREVTG